MKFVIVSFLLVFFIEAHAQIPNRYVEEVFADVLETKDVVFSTAVPQPRKNPSPFFWLLPPISVLEYNTRDVNLEMDIFEPEGDVIENRPLVILCFGGGFVRGSRDNWSMRLLAQGLARRGYVTASIDYRLGMDLYDQDLGARAVYRGVQDSRSAVRFFKANAELYNIDTSNVFIGGYSSGAFIALHNVYLDKESERPDSTYSGFQGSNAFLDLECLDCVGDNLGFNGRASAAFSLAGAIGDLGYIENSSDPPLLQFHSSDDGTVPYGFGEPFSDISALIIGSDLPDVYGSSLVSQRLDDLNIANQFNSYSNRGHDVHENGMVALHSDILPSISSWFFEQFLEPDAVPIVGRKELCVVDSEQSYSLSANDFNYYDWEIDGGSFMSMSTTRDQVEVVWDEFAAEHHLSVKGYLLNGAEAISTVIDVNVVIEATNSWGISSGGIWDLGSNWTQSRIPLTCEDVVISHTGAAIEILLQLSQNYQVKSLQLDDSVLLRLPANSTLKITKD